MLLIIEKRIIDCLDGQLSDLFQAFFVYLSTGAVTRKVIAEVKV